MTDTSSRLDGAFTTTLDRRRLLKIGAWAAPVIVLATAAPAAAATSGEPAPNTGGNGTPVGFISNPGAAQPFGPEMISGATSTTTANTWGTPDAPAANLTINGPFVSGALIQLMFTVPSTTAALKGTNPASWKWGMEGNGDNFVASWHPGSSADKGYWLVQFNAPSWASTVSGLYFGIRMSAVS